LNMQLGCMTRPWMKYSLDEALAGIATAGFDTVQFIIHQSKHLIKPDSTTEYLEQLGEKLETHGLRFTMISCDPDYSQTVADSVAWFGRLIPNIAKLGGTWLLSCGVIDEALYETWYSVTREACLIAAEHGIRMVLKPHGGIGATADGLLRCVERVNHPNFSICYDPGNVYYYTGVPAEQDVAEVAEHVSCTCVKDQRGGIRGEVMFTPGGGVVDFESIYATLRDVGYSGPNWLECVGGETWEEITSEARTTRAYMEKIWSRL